MQDGRWGFLFPVSLRSALLVLFPESEDMPCRTHQDKDVTVGMAVLGSPTGPSSLHGPESVLCSISPELGGLLPESR